MKKTLMPIAATFFAMLLLFTSCKKNDKEIDLTSDVTYQSDDEAMFSAEDNAISDEINGVMEDDRLLGGRTSGDTCNVTITRDSTPLRRFIVFNYNGNNCNGNRYRKGIVRVGILKTSRWKDVNAEITVEIQNLKITRLGDNKSLVINGTKTVKNVTGGLLRELVIGSATNIIHQVNSSNMSATFDNGTSRVWQIAKQRTFTYSNSLIISITGLATVDGATNVAVWGSNRFGQAFSTRIINPIVVKGDCGFRVTSGKLEHTKLTRDITVTFGLDASGNPTGCPGANPYYYKAEWTSANGTQFSVIKPY